MKILQKAKIIAAVVLALSTKSAHALDAPAALVPAGLNPGDQFYIIFVTSSTKVADSTDIADWNTYVNTVADLSSVKDTNNATITWRVLGATVSNNQCDPYDGDVSATPIYNTNGDKIADNRADLLDGSLDNAIGYDQAGVSTTLLVWTGCTPNGTVQVGFELGATNTAVGLSSITDGDWAYRGSAINIDTKAVYASSPKLTVAAATSASASPQGW